MMLKDFPFIPDHKRIADLKKDTVTSYEKSLNAVLPRGRLFCTEL